MDQAKIDNVLKLRSEYTAAVAKALESDSSANVPALSRAVGAWLDAENELSIPEYNLYQELWKASQA